MISVRLIPAEEITCLSPYFGPHFLFILKCLKLRKLSRIIRSMKSMYQILISMIFFLLFVACEKAPVEKSQNDSKPSTEVVKSPDGESYFPEGKGMFEHQFREAKLPSLLHKREAKGNVKFRFSVFPSFTKPIILTYSRDQHGAFIEVTRLAMREVGNSLERGEIELSGKVRIGNRIARDLEIEVMTPRIRTPLSYLTKEQKDMCEGLDGSTWMIEVSTDQDYTVEYVWTPDAILAEPEIFKLLERQKVNVETMADDLKTLIAFRDELLKLTDMIMPNHDISSLLDNG